MTWKKTGNVGISRSIEIVPAEKADVPDMVNAIVSAYKNDLLWLLARDFKDELLDEFEREISGAFDDHRIRIWKAVETKTKTLVGASIWGRFGAWEPAEAMTSALLRYHSKIRPGRRTPEFLERISDEMVAQRTRWILGKKCWLLGQLFVDSDYQRQGIGTMLLRKGLDEADKEETITWLESSPAGHGLYAAYGFNDVGSFSINFSEYGGEGFGWGMYETRFMLRLPNPRHTNEI